MNNYERVRDGVRRRARAAARAGSPCHPIPYNREDFRYSWEYSYDAERRLMSVEETAAVMGLPMATEAQP